MLFLFLAAGAEAVLVRVATFNIENGTGAYGSEKFDAIKAIIERVDADVIGFQELRSGTFAEWELMAAELGYPHTAISGLGPYSGYLYNGYFSRYPILETHNVTSPPGASELSRAPFRVVVEVPDALNPLVLWNMHKKASDGNNNRFRRAIETIRIVQDMEQYLAANPTHTEFVMIGDMNDDDRDSQTHYYYHGMPTSSFPSSYQLGDDIEFPVAYALFPTHRYEEAAGGMVKVESYWEGTTDQATRWPSMRQLDYLFASQTISEHPKGGALGEIYYSPYDTGIQGLYKAGDPLPEPTSETASDHMPVFMDIYMISALPHDFDVTPADPFLSSGDLGGPFTPSSALYTLTNLHSETSLSWSAVPNVDWITVTPDAGLLEAETGTTLTASINAQASLLPPGTHTGWIIIKDEDSRRYIRRLITLTVHYPPLLIVTPNEPAAFVRLTGGAVAPHEFRYALYNPGVQELEWSLTISEQWVTLSATNGQLAAQTTDEVTVNLHPDAHEFPQGIYTASLVFSNHTLGVTTTREVTLHITEVIAFEDDLESGASGWESEGLWYLASPETSSCPESRSGAHAWHYGRSDICTYDTGTRNFGSLVSPAFVVPDSAWLQFWSWEETESNGLMWDRRIVYISTNNGASWTSLYQSTNNLAAWHEVMLDLGGYAGETARIRFFFDTIDAVENEYRGWYLDDIKVAGRGRVHIAEPVAWTAEGPEGGPFETEHAEIVVSNPGGFPVRWQVFNPPAWLTLSETGATLPAEASAPIQLTVNAGADELEAGRYTDTLVFLNADNGSDEHTIFVELIVHDALPPSWRLEHFGVTYPDAALGTRAGDDPDEDGFSNWEEFIAHTDPTNPESYFKPIAHAVAGMLPDTWELQIEQTASDRVYAVYWKADLMDEGPWIALSPAAYGNNGTLTLTVTNAASTGHYRTGVRLP